MPFGFGGKPSATAPLPPVEDVASATDLRPDYAVARADYRMRVDDIDDKRRSRHRIARLRADRIPSLGTETISALRPGGSETLPKEPDTLCSAVIAPAAMAV